MQFFYKLAKTKFLFPAVLFFTIFLLSGGLLVVNHYRGLPVTNTEARYIVTAPFFGGFVLLGVMGLLQAYKFSGVPSKVFLGLFQVVFCYVGIEVLFRVVGGR